MGDFTGLRLLDEVTERGLRGRPTRSKPGQPLGLSSIYSILRNPYYKRLVSHKGVWFPGKHEPLIDDETWEQVQLVLD